MHCGNWEYMIEEKGLRLKLGIGQCPGQTTILGFDILDQETIHAIKDRDTRIFDLLEKYIDYGESISAYHNFYGDELDHVLDYIFIGGYECTKEKREQYKEDLHKALDYPLPLGSNNYILHIQDALSKIDEFERDEKEKRERQIAKEKQKSERDSKPGCVYLVKGNALFKIGKTQHLKSRLSSLQTSSPVSLQLIHTIESTYGQVSQLEKELHEHFANKRVNGEWFKLDQNDIKYIKGL